MRRAPVIAALVGLALLAACSKRHGPPNGPDQGSLPPAVTAVFPTPRSTVLYDTAPLWAEFAAPLDSATVSPLNVYLKVDDRRIPIAVAWEAATRRILIRPAQRLDLRVTHTVELSPNLKSVAGVPLGTTYFWQFTTNSLRRPRGPSPADGTRGESPFVLLGWTGNDSTAGANRFEVYAGLDSAPVAARSAPALATCARQLWLPRARWAEDTTTYWAVTAVNVITGERLDGPVWRLGTLGPLTATVEEIALATTDWGYQDAASRYNRYCGGATFTIGPGYYSGVRFRNLRALPADTRLAGARLELTLLSYPSEVSLWYVRDGTWGDCLNWYFLPPVTDDPDGRLATLRNPAPTVFQSDGLTAHAEATIRRAGYDGYLLRATQPGSVAGGLYADASQRPRLVLRIYHPNPAAAR